MLKIVPDPPLPLKDTPSSLEDLLVQTSEYLVCALAVAQQTAPLHRTLVGQRLTRAAVHEIHCAHHLVELALSKVHLQH